MKHNEAHGVNSKTIRIDLIKNVMEKKVSPAKRIVLVRHGKTLQRPEASLPRQQSEVFPSYQSLFNNIYEAGLICDLHGVIIDANRRALEFLNYDYDKICGLYIWDVVFGTDGSVLTRILQNLKNERFSIIDACCVRSDGSFFTAEIAASKLQEENECLCFFIRDTTVRLQLEAELAHNRKLESVGRLAAGIAHEINTPIQFLSDNTSYLGKKFNQLMDLVAKYRQILALEGKEGGIPSSLLDEIRTLEESMKVDDIGEKMDRAIQQSRAGLDRVASIVRALKEFSYPAADKLVPSDLNRAIQNAVIVTRNEWKYSAEMELVLDPNLPAVPCMLDEIGQVLLNIIVNARDAIVDKIAGDTTVMGRITITTRRNGEFAEIGIAETGTGIADDIKDLVFEPFFTTKEVGKGSGQGLAVVRNVIVNRHGGTISFHANEDGGTTLVIKLPLQAVESGAPA